MSRDEALARLRDDPFDVVVIGGGIVGAAVARDAVLRGLSVSLLERRDFAYGTSSRTSKLLHGGLRYLRQGHVGLVRQALRERDLLHKQEPRLVRDVRFLLPLYRDTGPARWLTRIGLWLYERFAHDARRDDRGWVAAAALAEQAPALRKAESLGAGTYHDCIVRDARLVIEVVKSAVRSGAVALNHVEVVALERGDDGRLAAARVHDAESGATISVRGRVFVNAAGPWTDAVRLLDDAQAEPLLRPTRGVHVLVPRARLDHEHAFILPLADDRVVFVLPWERYSLIGTTDTDDAGSPDEVAATAADVAYLLAQVNAFFPDAHLSPDDVVSTYAGLRPLLRNGGRESEVSRAHEVLTSPSGLVTVAGGKLTTHRAMAEDVVDGLASRLARAGRKAGPCRTADEPLREDPLSADLHAKALRALGLSDDVAYHLVSTYRSDEALPLLREDPALRQRLVRKLPYVAAEVVVAVRHELARTLEDVLARRTLVLYEAPEHGTECLDRVEALIAGEMDWTPEARAQSRADYHAAVARSVAFRVV